jgi:plastocyanin
MVMVWKTISVPAHAETIRVSIDKLEYSPAEITAKVGDTVEWVNKDFVAHTATVRGDWDVMIAANETASIVLKKTGDVQYYCRFHPNMKGRGLDRSVAMCGPHFLNPSKTSVVGLTGRYGGGRAFR